MRPLILFAIMLGFISPAFSQPAKLPCAGPEHRQFDFWIGEWDVYNPKGKKAGDSKISLILDSCIILEEWKSTGTFNGLVFSGKSFNSWNSTSGQWQQTWVDNVGGTTEYLKGKFEGDHMQFLTNSFQFNKDTMAIRRLTFYNLGPEKVRQLGEISKDDGGTWSAEFDLEYRRKKN